MHRNGDNAHLGNYPASQSYYWNHAVNGYAYAIWVANRYTITYIGNGANGGGTENSTPTYDSWFTLNNNGFYRTGYTFSYWQLHRYGDYAHLGNYPPGQSYYWNHGIDGYAIAIWVINQYIATFNANGKGTGKAYTQYYDTVVSLPTLRAIGYTFNGWATTNTATSANITTSFNMPENGRTLYAVWSDNTFIRLSDFEKTYVNSSYTGSTTIRLSSYRGNVGISTGSIRYSACKSKGPAPP